MKRHFPLLFFIDKSILIEELKQTLLITATSFIPQFDIDWLAALWIQSLLQVISRQTHILRKGRVPPQHRNFWHTPGCAGHDIKHHKFYPVTSPTLCNCPRQSPQCNGPPSDIQKADAQRDARLALQDRPPLIGHGENWSSSSKERGRSHLTTEISAVLSKYCSKVKHMFYASFTFLCLHLVGFL